MEPSDAGGSPSTLSDSAREEIGFWESELALNGKHPEVIRRRLDPRLRLEEFPPLLLQQVIPMIRSRFELEGPASCVEIGPGPLSTLAYGVDAGLLEVSAVDVLARQYRGLLERTGHSEFPIQSIAGTAESLLDLFPEESFHIAFAQNALDHTEDIARSFDNLVRLVKPDGAIVLEHHLREGTRQKWSDSHNWDLDIEGASLMATGRESERFDLSTRDDLELVYLHYRSELIDGWMEHVFRKR